MSKLAGFSPDRLVDAEAGIILKTCAARTKVAKFSTVRDGARVRALRGSDLTKGQTTINAGVRAPYGRVWQRNPETGKFTLVYGDSFSKINRRIADAPFAEVQQKVSAARSKMSRAVNLAKASAAIARQSWILIADRVGIRLESVQGGGSIAAGAIAKARGAKVKGNRQVNNGAGRREKSPGRYVLTLINRLPYGRRLGFERLLAATVAGRASFFATAVKKGFRGSLEQTAKLFPGWTVK